MKKTLFSLFCIFFLLNVFLSFSPGYAAKEKLCRDITSVCSIRLNKKWISDDLTDGNEETYKSCDCAKIVIDSPEQIGGIYIKFDRTPPLWTMIYKDTTFTCGDYGFLHEYQKIYLDNVRHVTLIFSSKTSIADIYVISRGDRLPDFVQTWRPAEGQCDIMLLACHSDDDQIFFAGSVPDAVSRGAEMQVCYFINHWRSHKRPHELLNGLWTCGLDRYPVIGRFPDIKRVDSEKEMLAVLAEKGYTYDQMVEDQVELLRKYKPQIVVVHDVYGEYGHGAHKLDSHSLRDAADVSNDPLAYRDSAEKYGVWDVPKIYLHLYSRNRIDFEIDVPLEYFGGKTAYQISQDAFLCHISQLSTRYKTWLLGDDEKPILNSHDFIKYSPREYGLWKTTVGADKKKTDFYENIVLLKDKKTDPPPPAATSAEESTEEETTFEETAEEETVAASTVDDTYDDSLTVTIEVTETDETQTGTETTADEPEETDTDTTAETETRKPYEKGSDSGHIVNICAACGIAAVITALIISGIKSKK